MDRDIQHREMQTAHMDSINTDYEHASEAMNEHALQRTRETGKQKLAYAKHQNSVKEKKKATHIKAKKALADVEDQRQAESDASMARINDMDNEARVAEATREKQREEARKKKLDQAREDADHWAARSEKSKYCFHDQQTVSNRCKCPAPCCHGGAGIHAHHGRSRPTG